MAKESKALTGKPIFAPAKLWPDYPPPKGQGGWPGKILGVKTASPEVFWVKFPGDPQKYFFQGKDVRSWLVEPKVLKPDGAGEKSTASQLPGTKRSSEPVTSPHKKNKQEAGPTAAVQRDLTKSSPTKSSKSMLLAELSTLTEQMTAQQLARLLADAKMIVK